jgi:hypothetical protein
MKRRSDHRAIRRSSSNARLSPAEAPRAAL